MRKLLTVLFLFCLATNLFPQVNGIVREISGKKVLIVWGNHQERGYAHGYLVGKEIKTFFDGYLLDYFFGGSESTYNSRRSLFLTNYSIENKYQTEAEAMLQGMIDSGVDLHNSKLGRNIDATDLLLITAFFDISELFSLMGNFGCSSMSSWGTSTAQDPILNGSLIITRFLDWTTNNVFRQNQLLIVNIPSEADEQKWVSFGLVGFLGAASGINESGVAAFLNQGNIRSGSSQPYDPIFFSIRNGIEINDYDQDNTNTPQDVLQAVQDRNRSVRAIIHVVKNEGTNSSPLIIECNNAGIAFRNKSDNKVVPGDNLVATNHFRKLYSPASCDRYSRIVNFLNESTNISIERSWSIMKNAAYQSHNLHAIQYIPSLNLIKWATTTASESASSGHFASFNLDVLFAKIYPDINLSSPFMRVSIDTLTVTSQVVNPDNYNLQISAIIDGTYNTSTDSIPLFNDGNHADGQANDDIWGNFIAPISTEDEFVVSLSTTNLDWNDNFVSHDVARFTTIGPVVLDRYTITSSDTFPNPGNRLKFQFTLKNEGLDAIAKNITTTLVCLDTCASPIGTATPGYGDIIPGKTSIGSINQYILFSKNSPTNMYACFRLDIASNGYMFWSDTFSVFIYPTSVSEEDGKQRIPSEFVLHQNYPNPFNSGTTIKYEFPKSGDLRLSIFNLIGQEVKVLVDDYQESGIHEVYWNGKSREGEEVGSGVYIYKFEAGEFVTAKKLLIIR